MSTEIQPHHNSAPVAWGDDQKRLVKSMICKPRNREATDDELLMFSHQCQRTGLDPFARQIYASFRSNRMPDGKYEEKMSIQVSIDGFRLIAGRSNQYRGQEPTMWCGDDGIWKDVWLSQKPPQAAKAAVWIENAKCATTAIALWREYAQTDRNGKIMSMWEKMPALMLGKCAEALALRKAFPNELGGLYTTEEMAQAEKPGTVTITETPAEALTAERDAEMLAQIKVAHRELKWSVPQAKQSISFYSGEQSPTWAKLSPAGKVRYHAAIIKVRDEHFAAVVADKPAILLAD